MDKLGTALDEAIGAAWRASVASVLSHRAEREPGVTTAILEQMREAYLQRREEARQEAIQWMRRVCGQTPPDDLGQRSLLLFTYPGWTDASGAGLH